MLSIVVIACALVAGTVAVHAAGLAGLVAAVWRRHAQPPTSFWPMMWLLVSVTWLLVLLHVIEIAVWGSFFLLSGSLPDAESAFYFSGVTYATVGYGDLVLPEPWRMLGPVEGLTGTLMCGLSTGFFFAFLSRVFGVKFKGDAR
jgi:hypothetical protein